VVTTVVAEGSHARGEFGRGLHLLERQFRVSVKVDIEGFDIGIDGMVVLQLVKGTGW